MKPENCIPCAALLPYVHSYAIHETNAAQTYKVLPGTGLVLGFQYKGKLAFLDKEKETALSSSGITGLQNNYRIFKNDPGTGSVLVYFKEAGAAHFFKQPLHEIFNQSLSLDNFMLRSELLLMEEKLSEASTGKAKIAVIEKFLLSRLMPRQSDTLVLEAISLIQRSRGNIRIKELTTQLHISQSPLEKRFRQAVGASPKKFASIIRLKSALQLYNPQLSLTDLGYEAGFYDQAHFIKEFKNFTGETPEHYFSGNQ